MEANVKQKTLKLIEDLPDDVTLEDIMYELYFRRHVEAGLKDSDEGRTVPHEEVERELVRWLRSIGR